MRHEKALDSEWEGTVHDKRKKERKDKTNIAQKEKREKKRPNPEREVEKKTERPGWRFFGAKYLFEDRLY